MLVASAETDGTANPQDVNLLGSHGPPGCGSVDSITAALAREHHDTPANGSCRLDVYLAAAVVATRAVRTVHAEAFSKSTCGILASFLSVLCALPSVGRLQLSLVHAHPYAPFCSSCRAHEIGGDYTSGAESLANETAKNVDALWRIGTLRQGCSQMCPTDLLPRIRSLPDCSAPQRTVETRCLIRHTLFGPLPAPSSMRPRTQGPVGDRTALQLTKALSIRRSCNAGQAPSSC